ncbi:hypothetical protein BV25DRAFT_1819539 [Artomyces pyxidatus]|uniref:Uncharacterized protein n=1 Tax=Artomyces pyxidatus TaxID=48021 RepID=A0ACB8TFM2_9AGAM|nr:hypothetical protein BV25DRAFT_1819539 [Artomyces pyxidatus]
MAPRNFTCAECTGSYESTRELSMHDCERHRSCIGVSPPSGPIKDRFLRIVHGWNCLSDPVNA